MKDNEYGLRWNRDIDPEKAEILCAEKFPVLKEVKELELTKKDSGSDQNVVFGDEVGSPTHLIIEGDNLHSLATLCYTHAGKIDLIIIDPTYNTGREDFRYNDKYVDKEDPDRHSKWLSMLEKRLLLSKILLSDRGSIFIMIGNDEFAQLKLLCDKDSLFGERNFRNCITWNYGGRGAKAISSQFPRNCDYIFWYSKSDDVLYNQIYSEEIIDKKYAPLKGYKLDDHGKWFYTSPRGMYTDESIEKLKKENRVYETRNGNLRIKYFIEERAGKLVNKKLVGNVWDDIPDAMHMSKNERLGFATQKPMALFQRIVESSTEKDSIVLDFFAGSGTAGHAVLDMNKKDGGKRQFILCTNNEIDEKDLNNFLKSNTITKDDLVGWKEDNLDAWDEFEFNHGICTSVCYPRIKKNIKELGGTLKYFKVGFIDRTENIAHSVAATCSGVLRIKENSHNELENNEDYEIYYQDNDSLLAIYKKDWNFNPEEESLLELRDILNGLEECENKTLYVFSTDDQVDVKEEFADWNDVDVKLMPFDIIDVYKRVFDYELKKGR